MTRRAQRPRPPAQLTIRQREFVRLYLAGPPTVRGNATRAATAAGYRARSARQQGARLLSKAAVQRAIAGYHARSGTGPARVLAEYARLAFSDLRRVATWGPRGLRLRASAALGADEAAAVAEVAMTRDGPRVKLHDKASALRDLARINGLLTDGARVLIQQTMVVRPEDLTDAQLAQLESLLASLPARDPLPDAGGDPG